MAFPLSQIGPGQQIRIFSRIKLQEIFSGKKLDYLRFFSEEIVPYLLDYFVLVNDLEFRVGEKTRKGYYDYSFLVFPVHKAFEGYITGLFSFVFSFPVSQKNGETIGYYLNLEDKEKRTKIESVSKGMKLSLSEDAWILEWKALAIEWSTSRNPLTHPGRERVETMDQAIMTASSIIRKMKTSSDLFINEFVTPIVERYKKQEEGKALSGYSPVPELPVITKT